MRVFILLFLVFISSVSFAKEKPHTLTIYCNDSFANDWMQIGHPIKRAFEFQCNCKVEFVTLSEGSDGLSRIMLEGKNSAADLVVGLDMALIEKFKQSGLFVPLHITPEHLNLPIKWTDTYFIPYNYAYLAFVYNAKKFKNPPKSFHDLINHSDENFRIAIQDPRTSSTGLGLLLWIKSLYPNNSQEVWHKLKKKILTITKGWSESYSLFTQGEADMVLSYNTSPAYHMLSEDTDDIKAAEFTEGHYLQIELIGKLKYSKEPKLADQFVKFVLSHSFQRLIPMNNFMLPVIDLGKDMPKEYNKIFTPSKVFIIESTQAERKLWIKEWLKALSKD